MSYAHGHTYFIQSVYGGPIKIGSSANSLLSRLKALQTGHPEPLRVLARMPGAFHEGQLHRRFADWRLTGEWFAAEAPGLQDVIEAAQGAEAQIVIDRFEAEHGPNDRSVGYVIALLEEMARDVRAHGYLPDPEPLRDEAKGAAA